MNSYYYYIWRSQPVNETSIFTIIATIFSTCTGKGTTVPRDYVTHFKPRLSSGEVEIRARTAWIWIQNLKPNTDRWRLNKKIPEWSMGQ